jgi:hypothetical protein
MTTRASFSLTRSAAPADRPSWWNRLARPFSEWAPDVDHGKVIAARVGNEGGVGEYELTLTNTGALPIELATIIAGLVDQDKEAYRLGRQRDYAFRNWMPGETRTLRLYVPHHAEPNPPPGLTPTLVRVVQLSFAPSAP